MSKKPTYNSFEDLIKVKLDKLESSHGKDWSAISDKLDKIDSGKKNKKSRSNLFLALALICGVSLVTVWYYKQNKPINTVVKNEALTTKIEESPVEKSKKEDVVDTDNSTILTESTLDTDKIVKEKNNSGDQNQQAPLYRDDTSNISLQDTTQNSTSIDPVLDSSTIVTTIGDSATNYNLTIISNKNQVCYDDSILLYIDGCDSCNILWVVNGVDYGNNKDLKIIGKEDIYVSLFEIILKDSTNNSVLKDSTTILVNRAPQFEINYEAQKYYVGLKKNSNLVCSVRFRKNKLELNIKRGNLSIDGVKSRGFFTFDDAKEIAREKSWTYKSGAQGFSYGVSLAKASEIDYIIYLLKQKYETL